MLPKAGLRAPLLPLLQLVLLLLPSLPICPPEPAPELVRAGISFLPHGMQPPTHRCFKKSAAPAH